MASNTYYSASSFLPPHSSSSLSFASQSDFVVMVKAFNYIPIRLDPNNYIFWKVHISATIRAFDLQSFLNKALRPAKYMTDPNAGEDGAPMMNPEFLSWMRLDQLAWWLFSTIDKELLTQVIHCELSVKVWSSLENLYSC